MKSPKRTVAAAAPCLVETPLAKWWHRRRNELRRCVVCGIAVKNENLAGYSGRSRTQRAGVLPTL